MGLLTRAFNGGERRGVTLSPELWRSISATATASGITISHKTALQLSAVWACVRVLSETLASLPLILYETTGAEEGKRRARGHALYPVLHTMANPEMTSFTLRETLQAHVGTWGNGYAEIEYTNGGDILALWPLRPDKTRPIRINGALVYSIEFPATVGGGSGYLPADRIFHVHGLGFDGLIGYSPVALFRQSLGLAGALEKFGAAFFGNGARPGAVLKYPGKLSPEGKKNLQDSWQAYHGGLDQAHRLAILEEGLDIETIGIPPDEAQFLASRQFQTTEIARIYRVPPHLIGDLEHATFSNIEHQGIEFVIHTMRSWLVRWEQEISRQLLTGPERDRYYAEFLVDALLRGDTLSRYQAYAVARQNGWLNADDIRGLENMDPIPGGAGKVYLVPLNMIPATAAGAVPAAGENGARAALQVASLAERRARGLGRYRLTGAWRRQYQEAAGRVIRREANDITNAARNYAKAGGPGDFVMWLEDFYRDHAGFAAGQLRPVAWGYGELIAAEVAEELGARGLGGAEVRALPEEAEPWAQRYVEAWASRHATRSKTEIQEVIRRAQAEGDPWFEALEAELEGWRDTKPAEIAAEESVRYNNGLGVHLYGLAGVNRLTWVTFDQSCPYCQSLDGQIVGIRGWFLEAGSEFMPEGAERPLTPGTNIRHAPAHRGCDCLVMAA